MGRLGISSQKVKTLEMSQARLNAICIRMNGLTLCGETVNDFWSTCCRNKRNTYSITAMLSNEASARALMRKIYRDSGTVSACLKKGNGKKNTAVGSAKIQMM